MSKFEFNLQENARRKCNSCGWITTEKHFATDGNQYKCALCKSLNTSRIG